MQVGGEAQQIAASQLMHQTVKAHGILGLWAGLGATLARDMPYLVLKWLTYVQMQGILGVLIPNANVANTNPAPSPAPSPPPPSRRPTSSRRACKR